MVIIKICTKIFHHFQVTLISVWIFVLFLYKQAHLIKKKCTIIICYSYTTFNAIHFTRWSPKIIFILQFVGDLLFSPLQNFHWSIWHSNNLLYFLSFMILRQVFFEIVNEMWKKWNVFKLLQKNRILKNENMYSK